jgi:hypothetical protein
MRPLYHPDPYHGQVHFLLVIALITALVSLLVLFLAPALPLSSIMPAARQATAVPGARAVCMKVELQGIRLACLDRAITSCSVRYADGTRYESEAC